MASSHRPRRGHGLVVSALLAAAAVLLLDLAGPAFVGQKGPAGLSVRPQPPTPSKVAMRGRKRGHIRLWKIEHARGDRPKGIRGHKHSQREVARWSNPLLNASDRESKFMYYQRFKRENASRMDGMYDPDEHCEYYEGQCFHVNRKTQAWRIDPDSKREGWPESGMWSKDFRMPMEGPSGFLKREPYMRKQWAMLVKKGFKKHGKGQMWANGKYVHLARLQHIPFTREKYGEMYAGKAAWMNNPNEVESRRRQMEAGRLRRRLEMEAELARLARLKDLGVYQGEQEWRRPWQPKIDLESGLPMESFDDDLPEEPAPELVGADAEEDSE